MGGWGEGGGRTSQHTSKQIASKEWATIHLRPTIGNSGSSRRVPLRHARQGSMVSVHGWNTCVKCGSLSLWRPAS